MSHFKSRLTAPHLVLSIAYVYVMIIGIILWSTGFYTNSTFFNWGVPITFFGQQITSSKTFYMLHLLIFFHQLINNWVNSVVYPWIINSVQDPKTVKMEYSTMSSLLLVNLFNVYSEFDVVFIVIGFSSQISFIFTVILANIITSTIINYQYLQHKEAITQPLLG